jgi:hypothetical protein
MNINDLAKLLIAGEKATTYIRLGDERAGVWEVFIEPWRAAVRALSFEDDFAEAMRIVNEENPEMFQYP